MCPDPFNELLDMTAIGVWLAFCIGIIKSGYFSISDGLVVYSVALIIWTGMVILCYFFAPRHSVCTGIPYFYQSRYKKWKTGRSDWDTRIFREEDR